MADNEFLPFATDPSANVETQVAWEGDAVVVAGFQRGIAPSAGFNKAWRQAGFPGVCLAEFMKLTLNEDVLDNGSIATFEDQLERALKTYTNTFTSVALTGDVDLYIAPAPTGSNVTGNGSIGAPWETLQFAYDWALSHINGSGYTVRFNVADGTYIAGLNAAHPIPGANVIFIGDTGTPTNCQIIAGNGNCFNVAAGVAISLRGFHMEATGTGGNGNAIIGSGLVDIQNVNFGACSQIHVNANRGQVNASGPYSVSGGAAFHWLSQNGAIVFVNGQVVTLTGTPAFSAAFAGAIRGSTVHVPGNTFVGGATGPKFGVSKLGIIDTETANINYLPGSTPGTTTPDGFYY